MIDGVLALLVRRASLVLAIGIFLGLLVPPLAALLRPLLVPSVLLLLIAAFYRLDWRAVGAYARRPRTTAPLVLWLLIGAPVATWAAVAILQPPPAIGAAIILMATAPPIISSVPFSQLLGLDAPLAAIALFLTTLLVPLTIPFMALELIGLTLDLGLGALTLRLAALAGGALAAALILRRIVPAAARARTDATVDGLTVVMLVVFAIAIMDGVAATLLARPGFVLGTLAAAFVANLALQGLTAAIFAPLGRHRALTAGLIGGNRNMALLLAAFAGSAEFDILLYFAIGQIPVYVMPALLGPLYRRLLATGG